MGAGRGGTKAGCIQYSFFHFQTCFFVFCKCNAETPSQACAVKQKSIANAKTCPTKDCGILPWSTVNWLASHTAVNDLVSSIQIFLLSSTVYCMKNRLLISGKGLVKTVFIKRSKAQALAKVNALLIEKQPKITVKWLVWCLGSYFDACLRYGFDTY